MICTFLCKSLSPSLASGNIATEARLPLLMALLEVLWMAHISVTGNTHVSTAPKMSNPTEPLFSSSIGGRWPGLSSPFVLLRELTLSLFPRCHMYLVLWPVSFTFLSWLEVVGECFSHLGFLCFWGSQQNSNHSSFQGNIPEHSFLKLFTVNVGTWFKSYGSA